MKIVYIAKEKFKPGNAAAIQVLNTLRGICSAGGEVRFVTPWSARLVRQRSWEMTGRGLPDELEIVSLGPGPDLPLLDRWWPSQVSRGIHRRIVRYLRRLDRSESDLVVYTRNRPVAAVIPKQGCPPMVFEYHEPQSVTLAEEASWSHRGCDVERMRREERAALRNAAALVTITSSHAQEAQRLYGFCGLRWVIPNGADSAVFSVAQSQRRPRPGHLLYVGVLEPWKGLDLAMEAVARLPGVQLHVFGGQPATPLWRDAVALRSRLGVSDRVQMYGTVPQQDLRPHLASAMAGLLPLNGRYSRAARYTCPLKLFEYLCAGLPVIATDLPSVRELVVHGREALLFEDRSADGLAAAISCLMSDAALAARLAQGASRFSARHTYRHRGQRILEVCRTVLEQTAQERRKETSTLFVRPEGNIHAIWAQKRAA